MQFYPGFSVVTGETGAGKSIIIGAIALLLGGRADAKQVKTGTDKCIVEATFDLSIYPNDTLKDFFTTHDLDYETSECLLRREVRNNGKSRAFINDTPVTLTILRELGEQLIDVHSQHQNLLLGKEDFQLNVVDIIAHSKETLADYQELYADYQHALHVLDAMRTQIARSCDSADFLRFQQQELEAAHLQTGEQQELEAQMNIMTHAEDIKRALMGADELLANDDSGILSHTRSTIGQLRSVSDVCASVQPLAQRLEECFIELKDIAHDIASQAEAVDYDPNLLNATQQRLDTIYTLQQKYHVTTIDELLHKLNDINNQLDRINNADQMIHDLEQQACALRDKCQIKATQLTQFRQKAATTIEHDIADLLVPLGIPNVRFRVNISATNLQATGADKVVFLFSANQSSELQAISQVASGGEIARVMLSLKAMISKAISLPTIIFDEIDTGVSGRVAEQMAHIMRNMGTSHRQVICITHLPQIAAAGTTHYKVAKHEGATGTTTSMTQLNNQERITEIAQMLSGADVSQAAIDQAKNLLQQ